MDRTEQIEKFSFSISRDKAYCQFSQQGCTNFMQTYSLISTHFSILTTNLHCSTNMVIMLLLKWLLHKNKDERAWDEQYSLLCIKGAWASTSDYVVSYFSE